MNKCLSLSLCTALAGLCPPFGHAGDMNKCMYVCMYVCMYLSIDLFIYLSIYLCTYLRTYACNVWVSKPGKSVTHG